MCTSSSRKSEVLEIDEAPHRPQNQDEIDVGDSPTEHDSFIEHLAELIAEIWIEKVKDVDELK